MVIIQFTTASFISLAKQNDKWDASYYIFTGSPRRKSGIIVFDSIEINRRAPVKLNYDSLYSRLVKCSMLTLNSDTINEVMDKKGQHQWMFLHSGPTNYTIQILVDGKRQTLNYKCPKYFYEKAKIDEFEIPLKVISSLLEIIGVKEPC